MGRPPAAALVAALVLVAPAALSPAALALGAPAEDPALLLVGFARDATPPVAQLRDLGATVVRVDERLDFAVVVAPSPTAFAALAKALPGVEYVEADQDMQLLAEPGDDELQAQQWGLAAVRAKEAWALLPEPDQGVTIAVLDTGSDWNHHDLADQLWNENGLHGDDLTLYASAATCALQGLRITECFYAHRPPEEVLGPMDFHGHGTHVAGIAAAERDGLGIAGVADATVHTYKVLPTGQSFFALIDVVASGIALAAADENDVISLSLGCFCESQSLDRAVEFAWQRGSVIVAAAGNSDSTVPVYPASYPEVISVSAVDETLDRWILAPGLGSSYGPTVDLAAPGANVLSDRAKWTANFGFYEVGLGYKSMSGTSMATPHVAGVAALVLQAWPEATNAQVREILEGSARDLGSSGYDVEYGHGLVDAEAAVRAALAAADAA